MRSRHAPRANLEVTGAVSDDALTITATVTPHVSVERSDPALRARDYRTAMSSWVKVSGHLGMRLVVAENSGHDTASLIRRGHVARTIVACDIAPPTDDEFALADTRYFAARADIVTRSFVPAQAGLNCDISALPTASTRSPSPSSEDRARVRSRLRGAAARQRKPNRPQDRRVGRCSAAQRVDPTQRQVATSEQETSDGGRLLRQPVLRLGEVVRVHIHP